MHHSRIERAPGAVPVVPEADVAAGVAALGQAVGSAASTVSAKVPTPGAGCFNAGVARMLTNWKES